MDPRESIRRKLRSVILLTCGSVLFLTIASFVAYEIVTFRRVHRENMGTLAEVIASTATSALAFKSQEDAADTLSALRAEPAVQLAVLYDETGAVFAIYPSEVTTNQVPQDPGPERREFRGGSLIVVEPSIEEKRVGTLYMVADLTPLLARLQLYSLMVLLILSASFLLAYFLSSYLQRRITRPILDLAAVARKISDARDYRVRASKQSEDEIGLLTEAFNHMLGQIAERDTALRESAERFRTMADTAPVMIWTSAEDGGWDYVNKAWLEFTGQAPERDLGLEWLQRVHPQDRNFCSREYHSALAARRPFDCESRLLRHGGDYRRVHLHGVPRLDDEGKLKGYIGTCLDVTDVRQAQSELERRVSDRTAELAETNRELESFTYSVSHDLRAPLRHINAYAQMLQEECGKALPSDAQKYLVRIRQGTKNMGMLVDDLLNLARVGRRELAFQQCDLNQVLSEVLNEIAGDLGGRNIEWRIEDLGQVQADPGLVKQVLTNLLSNAVKYTRPRDPAIIEVGRSQAEGSELFFVRDNGVGFNMKYAGKLFGVFQRLHRTEEFEGTGVGLATVDRIIRKHGGRIWAEAELDKGATFYFTLRGQGVPSLNEETKSNEPERS